ATPCGNQLAVRTPSHATDLVPMSAAVLAQYDDDLLAVEAASLPRRLRVLRYLRSVELIQRRGQLHEQFGGFYGLGCAAVLCLEGRHLLGEGGEVDPRFLGLLFKHGEGGRGFLLPLGPLLCLPFLRRWLARRRRRRGGRSDRRPQAGTEEGSVTEPPAAEKQQ